MSQTIQLSSLSADFTRTPEQNFHFPPDTFLIILAPILVIQGSFVEDASLLRKGQIEFRKSSSGHRKHVASDQVSLDYQHQRLKLGTHLDKLLGASFEMAWVDTKQS